MPLSAGVSLVIAALKGPWDVSTRGTGHLPYEELHMSIRIMPRLVAVITPQVLAVVITVGQELSNILAACGQTERSVCTHVMTHIRTHVMTHILAACGQIERSACTHVMTHIGTHVMTHILGALGGSQCRMSIIRYGNVALSNLRKGCVALLILRKGRVGTHVNDSLLTAIQ